MPGTFVHELDTPLYKGKISVNTGLFINGQFVDPIDKETIEVHNPTTGKLLTKVAVASAKDVDVAVKAARHAYKTVWGQKVPAYERGRLLNKLADLIEKHFDELTALEALDAGKPHSGAKWDIDATIHNFRYYAGWTDKNSGKTMEASIPIDETKFAYTRHEPIGVCGLIVPWNFPLLITSWKFAPALACGNSIILKPSEVTPLSALKLAELAHEAGFPPGVVNVLPGLGSVTGQAMSEHSGIGKISFTGSTLVGRKIMETAAKTNLKRVTLELGGKSPTIIFNDADLEQAVKWAIGGIFMHNGQVCAAGSRIFVQEGIYEEFLKHFVGASQSLTHGDNFDPSVFQGPLVSKGHMERVLSYIEAGKKEGATLLTGGARLEKDGYYIQPTIFTDVKPDMKIVKEEIFGPVAVVVKFKDEDDAIEQANNTVYGLSSNLFTSDISRALRVAHAIEAGSTYINQTGVPDFQVSFGGIKESGFGKDMGEHALEKQSMSTLAGNYEPDNQHIHYQHTMYLWITFVPMLASGEFILDIFRKDKHRKHPKVRVLNASAVCRQPYLAAGWQGFGPDISDIFQI
ncbi:hypothetical protein NM688_g4767 [Phlebia brevispora]|uniref:Uncharacterized protein n=1 Tax=Phlebia brevispora TaxID=194682 RepID=A0ACC1T257_9APHY|nr:hypothetical protein NM688_g4767 [Phlebia brevispora]